MCVCVYMYIHTYIQYSLYIHPSILPLFHRSLHTCIHTQLLLCEIYVYVACYSKAIDMKVEELTVKKGVVIKFCWYSFGFVGGLYSNMKALQATKIETVTVCADDRYLPTAVTKSAIFITGKL